MLNQVNRIEAMQIQPFMSFRTVKPFDISITRAYPHELDVPKAANQVFELTLLALKVTPPLGFAHLEPVLLIMPVIERP